LTEKRNLIGSRGHLFCPFYFLTFHIFEKLVINFIIWAKHALAIWVLRPSKNKGRFISGWWIFFSSIFPKIHQNRTWSS